MKIEWSECWKRSDDKGFAIKLKLFVWHKDEPSQLLEMSYHDRDGSFYSSNNDYIKMNYKSINVIYDGIHGMKRDYEVVQPNWSNPNFGYSELNLEMAKLWVLNRVKNHYQNLINSINDFET